MQTKAAKTEGRCGVDEQTPESSRNCVYDVQKQSKVWRPAIRHKFFKAGHESKKKSLEF